MSAHENKVKYRIDTYIRNSSQKYNIVNIILSIENILHLRHENKIMKEKIYLSGSVIIEAFLYKEILHSIKNIPVVINFLTYKKGGIPIPMKKQYITYFLVKVSEDLIFIVVKVLILMDRLKYFMVL